MPNSGAFHRGLNRLSEPALLFPAIALLLLIVIWAGTLQLIKLKRSDTEHVAAVSSRELLATYEAQVVRALREIDQTLTLVKYLHERHRGQRTLAELKNEGLLPSDMLFIVSIADPRGVIVESTRPAQVQVVADQDYFQAQRKSESFFIGRPARGPTGDANLVFSRRLSAADETFDGVVFVAIGAGYFVSGYDTAKLGKHGVLSIVGTDDIVRVRRTDDAEFSGEVIDYAALKRTATGVNATISINS
jgi:two-component system, NtrC family, sensor kinase